MIKCPSCEYEIQERFCPWCGYDATNPLSRIARAGTRVYVVQNQFKNGAPKFDLDPAERYGKLIYLLDGSMRPTDAEYCIRELHTGLKNFRDHDYLLLLGNPCLIGWTVAIASHYSGGALNLLQWEKRVEGYVVIQCDIMKTN